MEKDLRNGEDEMLEFQKQNNIGFIQEEGNSAAAYLVRLNQQYASLKTEYDLLSLLDLDQNLDRTQKTDRILPRRHAAGGRARRRNAFFRRRPGRRLSESQAGVQLLKAEERHPLQGPAAQASEDHQAER